jgi:mRNA interferase RelE/StbE
MSYTILFQPAARRELSRIEHSNQRRILAAIESLAQNPRPAGCTKMSGFNDVWRIRVGVFRIIYKIEDRRLIIEIVRVGHRRDVYRGL